METPEVLLQVDVMQYELLTEVFDHAFKSPELTIKNRDDFRILRRQLNQQIKSPSRILNINETEVQIIRAIMQKELNMLRSGNPYVKVSPEVKELYEKSRSTINHIINTLNDEITTRANK
jgi:hypothetical protein